MIDPITTNPILIVLLILLGVWTIIWKGIGLWKSAGKKHLVWFIAMIVFNTAGILPIIYLIIERKPKRINK